MVRAQFISLAVVLTGACSWFTSRPRPVSEASRPEMELKFRASVERAGGQGVWVKRLPAHPESFVEALATRQVYDRVTAALRAQASREKLRVRTSSSRAASGLRQEEFFLARGKQTVGRWRIRETNHILRAAIIIDDLGNDVTAAHRLLADLLQPQRVAVKGQRPAGIGDQQADVMDLHHAS